MKNKKGETNMFAIVGVLAVVAILGYFFLFRTGGGCETDADCASGQVCNLDGVCQAHDPCDWDNYLGLKPDSRCEENRVSDPDCPLFCPIGSPLASRAGKSGMCCVNEEENQVIDCDTGEPLFETEINEYEETVNILPDICGDVGLQAVVSFRPAGTTGTEAFMRKVFNVVTFNSPNDYPGDIISTGVWLKEVKIQSLYNMDNIVDAWRSGEKNDGTIVWSGSPQGSVSSIVSTGESTKRIYGTPIKFTNVGTSKTGWWSSGILNLDSLEDGDYTVSYEYCFEDEQGRMGGPQCDTMTYTMTKTAATISFTVNAELQ